MKLLEGKVALITGGTRGIGKGIVEVFAAQGAKVAFTYAGSVEKAQELEKSLSSVTQIKGYQSDASDHEAAQKLVDDVMAEFGKIDILINNAGITRDNLMLRMSKEDWDTIIKVNLDSVFNLTKAVIKPMMKARSGSIINMTSVVGVKGNAGQANYAASKAGVIGFTKSVAKEFASRGINVNAIAPGYISTDMTAVLSDEVKKDFTAKIPFGRIGQAEDVAEAVLFLVSDKSSYITGQTINVDGGMVM